MHPIDVATSETVVFVQRHLPPGPLRILEVGCGRGEVAVQLQGYGHHLIAIDSDASVGEQARQLGVDARVAQWPDFEEAAFDAILFTSSLHHIAPLAAALTHARHLLSPRGLLLAEDFAYHEIDPSTSEWCYSMAVLLKTCHALLTKKGFLPAFVESGGDFAFWQQNHNHELHSALTLCAEMKRVFPEVIESEMAYIYRYFLSVLPETEQGYTIATHLLELEKRMGDVEGIKLIGRRFVVRKQKEEML